ncbi:riboflavin kinase [Umbelopsis sp. WA50703]
MANSKQLNPNRPLVVGPNTLEEPYPLKLAGTVVKGFGRGSKELGIPTANLSNEALDTLCSAFDTGVYYGWTRIDADKSTIYPMVMSLGWNPYYNNEKRSAEVHIMHKFDEDFYGTGIKVIIAGYVRAEQNYPSLEALIEDINTDIEVANQSLQRPAYQALKEDSFFQN